MTKKQSKNDQSNNEQESIQTVPFKQLKVDDEVFVDVHGPNGDRSKLAKGTVIEVDKNSVTINFGVAMYALEIMKNCFASLACVHFTGDCSNAAFGAPVHVTE